MSDRAPCAGVSLVAAANAILRQPSPEIKAEWTVLTARLWRSGDISSVLPEGGAAAAPRAPDRPGRADDRVQLVAASDLPKRGKGGTLQSRQALLHSLVHIENWAIDLSWDIIARFGAEYHAFLPRTFFDDFVTVAEDECRHYLLLRERLEAIGSHYGAFPAHDGLWDSARDSAGSLPARLAVEHCVHEARGLDVLPTTIEKFRRGGDAETAALLQDVVYGEEVSHCAAGVRWLEHLHRLAHAQQQGGSDGTAHQSGSDSCAAEAAGHASEAARPQPRASGAGDDGANWAADARQHPTVQEWFHSLVRRHFFGRLKPPFNTEARARAGFTEDWYLPLATPPKQPPPKVATATAAAAAAGAAAGAGEAATGQAGDAAAALHAMTLQHAAAAATSH